VAKKPLFEQKTDRMVINVANNIVAAGTTALDVLERSPGILVDRQNNGISINGKDGVVVMINNKINRMPLSALIQMLATMSSDNIERIELITTPPANFDAEGNAGYINIILKQNSLYGTNGSFSVTGGYNKGEVAQGTFNFNHRRNRVNLYGDYSYALQHTDQIFEFYHTVTNAGKQLEDHSYVKRRPLEQMHNAHLGLDVDLNKKTTIGGLVSLYERRFDMTSLNRGSVFIDHQLDTLVFLDTHEEHPQSSIEGNINLQQNYKEGQKLTVNFNYVYYLDQDPVTYHNSYFDAQNVFLYEQQVRSNKNTPVHFWVGTIDYTQKLGKKAELEAGIKGTLSRFNNAVRVERLEQNTWMADPNLTATYDLKENIPAAYTTVNVHFTEKTHMKVGLRYEYTNSNLGSETQKDIIDRHYGKLFPSFFFSRTINENNSTNFSYSRRITRPTFWNLAPFVIFMDPNTYFSGNPGLQPAITDAVNASYSYKKKIVSLSYSYESSPITNFSPKVDPKTNQQTLAAENQKNRKTFSVNFSLPFEVAKWWNMQNNITAITQQLNGLYLGDPILIRQKTLTLNSTQTFKLPKEFTFSLSGFYRSPGLFGIYKVNAFGSLDAGVQKKLEKIKSTLRFNVSNILNTLKFKSSVDQPEKNLVVRGRLQFTNQYFRVTFTHNFGNDKLKGKRDRSTGIEEEKSRVQ
jgi:hypothetical protein